MNVQPIRSLRLAGAVAAFALAVLALAVPAAAKQFVQDDAGMFGSSTIDSLNTRLSNFNAQTGKEVVVLTVPSVSGGDVQTAAHNAFSQRSVNGVLIFIDKGDRRWEIVPDNAGVQAGWFTSSTTQNIGNAMQAQFKAGDFDGGITTAVNGVLDIYRSHLSSLRSASAPAATTSRAYPQAASASSGGGGISVFWWIIIALIGFFIIRAIIRAMMGPRYYGGYGAGAAPPGAGYGGYGPGYGYGGWGGGGFMSGLLGGLGGAWLGNELFRGGGMFGGGGGYVDPSGGGAAQPPVDAGGWASDPGSAGMGGAAGGDWSGGGFGGGDFGGGGGGFGGGGDAGGGW